jgi:hypothetical protein
MLRISINYGATFVRTTFLRASGATALALAVSAFAFGASAQDKKAPKAAPPASACKGLDDAACKGKSAECSWIAPKKGKQKPYCRAKPKSAAKKK